MSKGRELQGIVPLELGGKTYKLRFDLNAFCALEERFGSIDAALKAKPSLVTTRALLWVALQSEHADEFPTELDVGRLIDMTNFQRVMEAVGRALATAFPRADDSSKNK